MSSILDALAKIEAARTQPTPGVQVAPTPRSAGARVATGLAAAFAIGAGLTYWFARTAPLPALGPPRLVTSTPPPPPVAQPLPLVPALPAPPPATDRERPWGEEVRAEPPAISPPAIAPRVRVSFLVYSPVAERRSVALRLEDGNLVTLREGEGTGGLRVSRILPDRVELSYGGAIVTVRATD